MGPSADQVIRQAVTEKRLLGFTDGGKLRIAEPHDYGVQKGNLRLLSYQVSGQRSVGNLLVA